MKKSAFTMLELVFVIVVAGILAAVFIPRLDRNHIEEASLQIMRHIRYAQHLAMSNDVFNHTNVNWYLARPQISFRACTGGGSYYFVGSDSSLNGGHIAEAEAALDPLSQKALYSQNNQCDPGAYPNRNGDVILGESYGVSVASSCGSTISFDNLGRPYTSFSAIITDGLMTAPCTLTIADGNGNEGYIVIEPETGFVNFPTFNF